MKSFNNQIFQHWLVIRHDEKFVIAGTQRMPTIHALDTIFVYMPSEDDFTKVSNADIYFVIRSVNHKN